MFIKIDEHNYINTSHVISFYVSGSRITFTLTERVSSFNSYRHTHVTKDCASPEEADALIEKLMGL